MIKELRKMRAKGGRDKSVAGYISQLQYAGKLTTYTSAKGYVAYDTEEFKAFKKNAKKGRPRKERKIND